MALSITPERLLDAQAALLGDVIISPEIIGDVVQTVSADDFTDPTYRHVYEAILRLWNTQETIDVISIEHELGEAYRKLLLDLMQITPTAANWRGHAAIVKNLSRLRRLQQLGTELSLADTEDEAREILERANHALVERPNVRSVSLADGLREFFDRQSSKEPVKYIPWGFPKLDGALTIEPGDFVILGGEPSSGKTALAIQFATTMAKRGYRVGVFSLETSDRKVYDRWVAQTAGIALERVKYKKLTDEDWAEVSKLGRMVGSTPIEVVNAAYFTVADIQALALAKRFDVVIVDYVQIIRAPGVPRFEAVTDISIALHTMAQTTRIMVLGLSQLSRPEKGTKKREAKMSDLRESGQLEQDADAIMILQGRGSGARTLSLVKNKDGRSGNVPLYFEAEKVRFLPAEQPKAEPDDGEDEEDDEPRARHQGARSRR